jgi:hypothetical protein
VSSAGATKARFSKRNDGRVVRGRNKRTIRKWRGRGIVYGRKKRAIHRAVRRACCRREKETSDLVSGTAGKASAREKMSDSASGPADVLSVGESNERLSKQRGRRVVHGRNKRAIQQTARRARRR